MANLNLSEFTEKLFVADADHTFIWDTAASISKRVSRNSWLNSGTLTSDAPVTISQTWNGTGSTVFTALRLNVTDTASDPSSGLLELWSGSTPTLKFKVDKTGITLVGGLRTSSGALTINATNIGGVFIYGNTRLQAGSLNFNATTFLHEDAANTLALRNGAAAQTFRVYNTYTDASNYERAIFSFNSNRLEISTGQAGAGVSRKIDFGTNGATGITFFTNTTNRWGIGSDGHLVAAADNTYDIGASGANRPRNLYLGGDFIGQTIRITNINTNNNSNTVLTFTAGTDNLLFATGGTSPRINFCGTTNLFPAIKRSSTTLQARLADDSAFAPIQGKLTTETAFTATTVTPTGFITLYDSTGAAYKVPCVPA